MNNRVNIILQVGIDVAVKIQQLGHKVKAPKGLVKIKGSIYYFYFVLVNVIIVSAIRCLLWSDLLFAKLYYLKITTYCNQTVNVIRYSKSCWKQSLVMLLWSNWPIWNKSQKPFNKELKMRFPFVFNQFMSSPF